MVDRGLLNVCLYVQIVQIIADSYACVNTRTRTQDSSSGKQMKAFGDLTLFFRDDKLVEGFKALNFL